MTTKLLVCHDMKGNYLSDIRGNGALFEDAFCITGMRRLESFCYFSHHFVSVPPRQWVKLCKKNGVKVLGAILTEWDAGQKLCAEAFKSTDDAGKLAAFLFLLSKKYMIDGWLVNIENSLSNVEVKSLLHFLRVLRALMRSWNPDSLVIWYVTVLKRYFVSI